MSTSDTSSTYSVRNVFALLGRIAELTILTGGTLNLAWVFLFPAYQEAEIAFVGFLQILAATFLVGQFIRLFVDWRKALLGISRALFYLLFCGLRYL